VIDRLIDELDAVLSRRAIDPLFQPIVEIATGDTVAYEALACGPVDGPLRMPQELFDTAREAGRLDELDELCRTRAVESAVEAGLRAPFGLFVNVEPAAIPAAPPAVLAGADRRGIRVVVELTERALTRNPARLLAFAERVRAAGVGIALDDVGADPDSLALMPFLRPEVVKLDLRLVQRRPNATVAEIMTAVTAYAEQCGAIVLAEGIESEVHERTALSLGASLGQGWRYGRPAPLPHAATEVPGPTAPRRPLVLPRAPLTPTARSPYGAVARLRAPQRGSRSLLAAISRLLERQASELRGLAVVLATFEKVEYLSSATSRRYARLAASSAFVAVLGAGMPAEPVPGVRGAELAPDDPVLGEWDVVVVGPHFAAALVARDLDPGSSDPDCPFDFLLTYDRMTVLDVARSLMSRALPADRSAPTTTMLGVVSG